MAGLEAVAGELARRGARTEVRHHGRGRWTIIAASDRTTEITVRTKRVGDWQTDTRLGHPDPEHDDTDSGSSSIVEALRTATSWRRSGGSSRTSTTTTSVTYASTAPGAHGQPRVTTIGSPTTGSPSGRTAEIWWGSSGVPGRRLTYGRLQTWCKRTAPGGTVRDHTDRETEAAEPERERLLDSGRHGTARPPRAF